MGQAAICTQGERTNGKKEVRRKVQKVKGGGPVLPAGDRVISFPATVYKVQTLIDGGLRVTLDLPETAITQAAALMECKRVEIPLKVTAKKDTE